MLKASLKRYFLTGLLVITHDPAIAARAGRVLKMVDGRVAE